MSVNPKKTNLYNFLKEYERICLKYGFMIDSEDQEACLYSIEDNAHTLYYNPDTAQVLIANDDAERVLTDYLELDDNAVVVTVKEIGAGDLIFEESDVETLEV